MARSFLRIAQVAPLFESVPPTQYGGTERIVSYLTEELVRQGHDVTLFASGDSCTRARLIPACPRSIRTDPVCTDPLASHLIALDQLRLHADDYDVIHYHTGFLHFPLARALTTPRVTTLHGRLDLADIVPLFRHFNDEPVVSISDDQRGPLPWINWVGTVYHGLPPELLRYQSSPAGSERYLAFVGRISPEKAPDVAIEISRRSGVPLKIGAKVDAVDREYFSNKIEPLLDAPGIQFIGEVDDGAKASLIGNAAALLFPIDWPEPFGLVMIEALACGTPVIARPRGSVREIISEGRTGFICESVDEAVKAVGRLDQIDRRACRAEFESRFLASRMAGDYVQLYYRLLASRPAKGAA